MNEDVGTFFAPITLLIGGALIAGGLLSFLDINFFRTKLQARLALVAGLVFMLATETLFLTSSSGGRYFAGQQIDLTDCEYQVEQAYPRERSTNKRFIAEQMRACMDRLGYEWTQDHPHCREAQLATNTFCYLPKGPFDRTIVGFQMKFE